MLVVAAALADLCAPGPPAPVPSPTDSLAYTVVGDDARAAADPQVAATAYRLAVALDPGNARARAGLAEVCRTQSADVDADDVVVVEAMRRARAGDLDGAAALATTLAGRGVAGAHFVLGLVALLRHQARDAERELAVATAADPAYGELAPSLLRLARRDGAVAATILAEPELDTNPQLVPDTPPIGATTGPPRSDEALLLLGTVVVRPRRWLALQDVVLWRQQRTQSDLDFASNDAAAEIDLDHRTDHLALRYDLDAALLGGATYLLANRAAIAVRRDRDAVSLVATYALRRRDYAKATETPFTGWVHAGEAGVVVHLSAALDLDARAQITREETRDSTFTDVAVGAAAMLRARPMAGLRVTAFATGWYARYDGAEPDGELRRDEHGEGGADLELDLGDHVIGVAGASFAANTSTIDDFHYWKLVVRVGVALAFGAR